MHEHGGSAQAPHGMLYVWEVDGAAGACFMGHLSVTRLSIITSTILQNAHQVL